MIDLNRKTSNNGFGFEVAFPAFHPSVYALPRPLSCEREREGRKTACVIFIAQQFAIYISLPFIRVDVHHWNSNSNMNRILVPFIEIHISLGFRLDLVLFSLAHTHSVCIPRLSHTANTILFHSVCTLFRFSGRKNPKALRSKLLDFYFLIKTEFIHEIWLCAFRIRCNSIVYIWIDVFQPEKPESADNINQRLQHFKMQYFDVDRIQFDMHENSHFMLRMRERFESVFLILGCDPLHSHALCLQHPESVNLFRVWYSHSKCRILW